MTPPSDIVLAADAAPSVAAPTVLLSDRLREPWQIALSQAVRTRSELLSLLNLENHERVPPPRVARDFPLLVPRSYVHRIRPGDPDDPLFRQVWAAASEDSSVNGFTEDAVGDEAARLGPGILQKYRGRALLVTTGACAIHCRYCFRRHYPYSEEPRQLADWEPALQLLAADPTIMEVLLSGGDPLTIPDRRLSELLDRLDAIPHLQRVRIHTRLPVVLPERVTTALIDRLVSGRLQPVVVIHANHSQELQFDAADAIRRLSQPVTVLNQAVLLRGVNDSVEALVELSERLMSLRVLPYYLHQLDRVTGAAEFEVPVEVGKELISELHRRLPGYLVPRYVQEVPGAPHKVPISLAVSSLSDDTP
jgi:EF-P beta-lysylation protein EpmB